VRHEEDQVSSRVVVITAVSLVVTAIVIHLALWGLHVLFERQSFLPQPGNNPLALEDSRQPLDKQLREIPGPQLEGLEYPESPHPWTRSNRKREEKHLDIHPEDLRATSPLWASLQEYGPAQPQQAGYVSIPVARAMQVLVEQKRLPVTAGAEKTGGPRSSPFDRPTSSNSGKPPARTAENSSPGSGS